MLLEQKIREVYEYQRDYFSKLPSGTTRNMFADIDLKDNFVKILTGIRRSGKSTLMLQLARQQKQNGFINFEDPRLSQFEVNDFFKLEKILQAEDNKPLYFFDEIQNVNGWEKFIRILHDKKIKVVISGSNASLLSTELGSSLTGRQITYEVFPFSYSEFLNHTNLKGGLETFKEYLDTGGFPEYITTKKAEVLIQLFNDLIYRDIVVRHGLRNAQVVRNLGVFLASNVGKEFSYNRLTKNFELGSVNTVQAYISYFEDAYLFFTVPRFSFSLKQQAKNMKKIYCIDTGLVKNLSLSFSKDMGRLLENLVFVEFRRFGKKVYYFRNENECDFVVSDGSQVEQLVQVCYELNSDNLQRELNGLLEAMKTLNMHSGLILTMNQEDTIVQDEYNIIVKPVWRWMLED